MSNCIPNLCHTYIRCLNTLKSFGLAYGSTLNCYHHRGIPRFGGHMAAHSHCYHQGGIPRFEELTEILDDVSVEMIPVRYR
jgi:hypothetical protein